MAGKEKPMIMSTLMVDAILKGWKRQTRRPVFKNGGDKELTYVRYDDESGVICAAFDLNHNSHMTPKAVFGDKFWVKETWQELHEMSNDSEHIGVIVYKASENGRDWAENTEYWKWKPSLFMPKKHARIWLNVESVRIERLGEISELDARMEGIEPVGDKWRDYGTGGTVDCPLASFKSLWVSIYKEWTPKKWVWVYDFNPVDKPKKVNPIGMTPPIYLSDTDESPSESLLDLLTPCIFTFDDLWEEGFKFIDKISGQYCYAPRSLANVNEAFKWLSKNHKNVEYHHRIPNRGVNMYEGLDFLLIN